MTDLHLEAQVQRGGWALAVCVLAGLGLASLAFPAGAQAAGWAQRLDPRLSAALVPGADPVPVWVEFVDKGEQGPGDLERRLAAAERALTPEARARRIRARLHPLVDYLDLPLEPSYLATLTSAGYRPYGASRWLNACCVRTSGAALAVLASLDCVRLVSPAQQAHVRRPETPVDAQGLRFAPLEGANGARGAPEFYGQTYTQLQRLNVPAVHDSGYTGAGVLVAVFDEGFDYYDKHEATRNIDVGNRTRDFVRGGTVVQDTVGFQGGAHGTNVLSVLAGNAPGIYIGPAYGARFALARTEDIASEKPVEMVNWLNAAEWADSLGADIISSSLGYFDFPDSANDSLRITYPMLNGHTTIITRAAEIAAAKGIIVVNSAGNSGPNPGTLDAPADANGDSLLAIGAVDSLGVMYNFTNLNPHFSSRGPTADGRIKPDLCAQGYQVLIASGGGSTNFYFRADGTSFSCPLVAGLAACLISARPDWPPIAIIRGLKLTAGRATHPDNNYGWGVPDGMAVLRWEPDTLGVPARPLPYLARLGENPTRSGAELRFGLPLGTAAADARVDVYDVSGRRVRDLWHGTLVPGLPIRVTWDGADAHGHARASGLYFASLDTGGRRTVLRLATIR